jgi:hypothetical protein
MLHYSNLSFSAKKTEDSIAILCFLCSEGRFEGGETLRGERGRKIDRRRWRMKGDFSSGSNLGFAERDLWSNDGKTLSCNGASKAARGFVRKSLRRCRCSFCVAEKGRTREAFLQNPSRILEISSNLSIFAQLGDFSYI